MNPLGQREQIAQEQQRQGDEEGNSEDALAAPEKLATHGQRYKPGAHAAEGVSAAEDKPAAPRLDLGGQKGKVTAGEYADSQIQKRSGSNDGAHGSREDGSSSAAEGKNSAEKRQAASAGSGGAFGKKKGGCSDAGRLQQVVKPAA